MVTIGMPVYNAERTIRGALDALLLQSHRDFKVVVSDNASTDGTSEICRSYSDPRVRYVRQPRNIGAQANFRFVLEQAQTEFFMWAAADDTRSPDFLAVNLRFLLTHPDYVGSVSPVRFPVGQNTRITKGDATLADDDHRERIIKPLSAWHANGRFYSVFRREALKGLPFSPCFAWDWILVNNIASKGKLNRVPEGWLELGCDGESNKADIFAACRKSIFDRVLPFRRMSQAAFRLTEGASLGQKARLSWRLLRLSILAIIAQFTLRLRRRT